MENTLLLSITGNRKVEVEVAQRDINSLHLDLFNPRFKHKEPMSQEQIEKEIWEEADTKVLFNSILESKGISEPLFIRRDGTVLEGNRRAVCLKKIRELHAKYPQFPREGFLRVPVYIFPDNLAGVDLDVFLARLHVSGKKEWDALNQAEHLHSLKAVHNLTYDQISNLISMSKGKIFQKIWSFQKTKEFLEKYPKQPITKYSFFEEAYKKRNIRAFIDNTEQNKQEFFSWIVSKKFDRTGAKDIRDLSVLMTQEKYFNLFKQEGITAAYLRFANEKAPPDSTTFHLMEKLLNALNEMSRLEVSEISKDKRKKDLVHELSLELRNLLEEIK